jgi:hypothetical protein
MGHYDPTQHAAHLALYGQDGGPVCLCRLAMVLWYLGYPEQALAQVHAALAMVEELAHPFSRAYVLLWLAVLYNHRRVVQDTQKCVDTATQFATEQGFLYWYTQGVALQGGLLSEQGHAAEGIALMRQGWRICKQWVQRWCRLTCSGCSLPPMARYTSLTLDWQCCHTYA